MIKASQLSVAAAHCRDSARVENISVGYGTRVPDAKPAMSALMVSFVVTNSTQIFELYISGRSRPVRAREALNKPPQNSATN